MGFVLGFTGFLIFRWVAFPSITLAGVDPLKESDIRMVLAVRNTADALRDEEFERISAEEDVKRLPFSETVIRIQYILQKTDEEACSKHGVRVDEYRRKLRRIVNVHERIILETAKEKLREELQRRRSMNDAEISAEAERQRASTEAWFQQIKAKTAPPKGGTPESRNPDIIIQDRKRRAVPKGYVDSLEQIVMQPMREKVASGKWKETFQQSNAARIEEIQGRIRKIDAQLTSPEMRQAALDRPAVLEVLDLQELQELPPSLVEDGSGIGAAE
ncbi:MAG: hypothetical protein D6795_18390 [Deltaproteobacteria bacterium]|nr:MAG: hypothetical protein D6795_18390 [Deltaproteobacteria bacterium]